MKKRNIKFIESLGREIREKGIDFFFLDERWKDRGDIDVCVSRKDFGKLDSLLRKKGFIKKTHFRYWKKGYILYKEGELLCIDVHIGKYEGSPAGILDPENTTSIYLSPEKQLFYFIYRIGLRNPIRKYIKYLNKQIKSKKLDYSLLQWYLGKVFYNEEEILTCIKKKEFEKIKPKFKISHNVVRLLFFLRNKFFDSFAFLYRVIRPYQYIVLIGPDGSGKTTLRKEIAKILSQGKLKVFEEYGGRYSFKYLKFLNPVVKVVNKKGKKLKSNARSSEEVIEHNSVFIKIFSPFIYYFEYLLRYLFSDFFKRRKGIIIADRHYIDIFVSKNINKKIAKFLYCLLPKPSFTILLYNSLEVLKKRKPSHPEEDIERQVKEYLKLRKYCDLVIKTDNKKKNIDTILKTIIQYL